MSSYEVLLPAFARFEMKDFTEFVETDSGKALGAVNAEYAVALTQARLFVGDESLAEGIARLALFESRFADLAVGPVMKFGRPAGGSQDLMAGLAYVYEMRSALDVVEAVAVDLMRAQTARPRSSGPNLVGWWSRRAGPR